jgi:predicted regulator of Ras-like GTPase activity (Roadblock/LC7/MglB family)
MFPIYSNALKLTINEIKNVSPEVSSAFVFKKDGEIIAQDDNTTVETINDVINVFNEMTQRIDAIGGLENLTIQGSNGQMSFTPCINDLYLATVSSKIVDEKVLYALTRVLVPTIVKLMNQLTESGESQLLTLEKTQLEIEAPEKEAQTGSNQITEPVFSENNDILLPEPPVHQLMIEKIGGLLASSDTVRIDNEVIANWNELYEGKTIERVNIETLKMKTTQCKFKPIKETKSPTKGIIQMPEKIQQTLEAAKGELVMVKPIIET